MGFGTVFASFAFVAIVALSSYLLITGTIFSMDTLMNSFKELSEVHNNQMRTEIEIENISVTNTDSDNRSLSLIDVKVNNTGATKVLRTDFEHIDVFVFYAPSVGNATIHRRLAYNDTIDPADNEWTVVDITPDLVNPRTFDPDEQMTIRARIYPAIKGNSTSWLKVVMPNAVSDAKYFAD